MAWFVMAAGYVESGIIIMGTQNHWKNGHLFICLALAVQLQKHWPSFWR